MEDWIKALLQNREEALAAHELARSQMADQWKIRITVDMSTSPNAVSAFMLSFSEFACLVSEQHYRFLSQSLNDLEHQIEQH